MLLDELLGAAPHARVVTIDTGVLFPETLQTWRAFEERFGVHVDVEDASRRSVDGARALLRRRQGRGARARAGRRRRLDHRHPPRAGRHARQRAVRRVRRQALDVEVQPARGLDRARPLAAASTSATCPTTRCTTRATPRSAARPAPSPATGRDGRWAGTDKIECGLHVEHEQLSRTPTADPPAGPRGGGDPRHARGRRRARAPGAAVLRRQGLDRAAAPGREGLPPGALSRSRSCTSTPATTSPRSSSSATGAWPSWASG